MAMASDKVRAEVIDAEEFPALSQRYQVSGVPKTMLNYQTEFVGAAPEGFVLEQIAARFEEKAGIPAAEFLSLAKTGAAQFAGKRPYLSDAYKTLVQTVPTAASPR